MKIRKKGLLILTALVLSILITGIPAKASAESLSSLTALAATAAELESPFKTVYDQASQSIVAIRLTSQLFGYHGAVNSGNAYAGSGVVISDGGYIITNYHVLIEKTGSVSPGIIVNYNGVAYFADYIAGDAGSDIAVLQVSGLKAPAARIGNSDEISIGDWALAIGNPIGEPFTNTLTVGVISGTNRDVSSWDSEANKMTTTTMIQTNAQVNAGNSGGGLFNIRGELVGITAMKLSGNDFVPGAFIEGIGLAIPINTVTSVADDLIEFGEVR